MEPLDRTWRLWIVATGRNAVDVGVLGFVIVPIIGGRTARARCIHRHLPRHRHQSRGRAGQVPAQTPATKLAWTATAFAALAHADKAAGEAVAQATCVPCHAADGTSPDPAIPRMAGQSIYGVYKELEDFKSGARTNDTMSQMVQPLDAKQLADVAAYYAR